MKIDEAKTPFHRGEDGESSDEEKVREAIQHTETEPSSWDESVNVVARKARFEVASEVAKLVDEESGPPRTKEPAPKRAKLTVTTEISSQELAETEQRKKDLEFKLMRRKVYADEGKMFKAQRPLDEEDDGGPIA